MLSNAVFTVIVCGAAAAVWLQHRQVAALRTALAQRDGLLADSYARENVANARAAALRRAFATHFALQNQGNPLAGRLLQKQLGHSTFAMTDHYILHDADDLRAVIRSPLV